MRESLTHSLVICPKCYHSPCEILQCVITCWKGKFTIGIKTMSGTDSLCAVIYCGKLRNCCATCERCVCPFGVGVFMMGNLFIV